MAPRPSSLAAPRRPIATQNEGALHAALKHWYFRPGDEIELPVDGRQIDLVRGDLLIEIQTRGFAALREKLAALLEHHRVRLVHPIATETVIVRADADGQLPSRRKSPRRGSVFDLLDELPSVAHCLVHPRFSLHVLFTREEQLRGAAPERARRGRRPSAERRLLDVIDERLFSGPADFAALLPKKLPEPFTTAELAAAGPLTRDRAQKLCYCLRAAGVLVVEGKLGRSLAYRQSTPSPS